MLIYLPQDHQYKSTDPNDTTKWVSVTRIISQFKQKFDPVEMSIKCSKNPKSKWYKKDPAFIQKCWSMEGERSTTVGTFYHDQRERDTLGISTINREGIALPIMPPLIIDGIKHATDQKLKDGIYPEHFVYLSSAGICGQIDRLEIINGSANVYDYKTNKEIKKEGFKKWDGTVQKMNGPCAHLDDVNFNHYALQLSMYLYIVLKHNPRLKPGKLVLHHIIFEKEGEDEYGFPIIKKTLGGEPIVKEVIPYDVPYLKSEVINIINYLKNI